MIAAVLQGRAHTYSFIPCLRRILRSASSPLCAAPASSSLHSSTCCTVSFGNSTKVSAKYYSFCNVSCHRDVLNLLKSVDRVMCQAKTMLTSRQWLLRPARGMHGRALYHDMPRKVHLCRSDRILNKLDSLCGGSS